jgi:small-conductance mechanosensitive channel
MEANTMLEFYLESYKTLLRQAQEFPQNLGSIQPEEILEESQKLQAQQKELRRHDELMLQALQESDHDDIDWNKVGECQDLIQQVVDIFDTIAMKAHTHKAMLADELKKVSKGLSGLKGYSNTIPESGTLLKRTF